MATPSNQTLPPVQELSPVVREGGLIARVWFDWHNTFRTLFLLLNGRVLFGTFTNPNGNVSAGIGALYSSLTDGSLWSKTSNATPSTVWTAR